jgi:hypothetical protein
MTFLPGDYKEVPQAPSGYMKFKKGANRFRILSPAIVGWEYWNKESKPVRKKDKFTEFPSDIKLDGEGNPTRINHFWAFVVWNYEEKSIQVLEITQSTVQRAMKIKIDNRGGDALGYDFIITRSGEGFDTEYDIDTGSPEPVSPEITKLYTSKKINLEALYSGGDPFAAPKPTEQPKSSPGADSSVSESPETVEEVKVEDIPF